jgi:hypothetical protein
MTQLFTMISGEVVQYEYPQQIFEKWLILRLLNEALSNADER